MWFRASSPGFPTRFRAGDEPLLPSCPPAFPRMGRSASLPDFVCFSRANPRYLVLFCPFFPAGTVPGKTHVSLVHPGFGKAGPDFPGQRVLTSARDHVGLSLVSDPEACTTSSRISRFSVRDSTEVEVVTPPKSAGPCPALGSRTAGSVCTVSSRISPFSVPPLTVSAGDAGLSGPVSGPVIRGAAAGSASPPAVP